MVFRPAGLAIGAVTSVFTGAATYRLARGHEEKKVADPSSGLTPAARRKVALETALGATAGFVVGYVLTSLGQSARELRNEGRPLRALLRKKELERSLLPGKFGIQSAVPSVAPSEIPIRVNGDFDAAQMIEDLFGKGVKPEDVGSWIDPMPGSWIELSKKDASTIRVAVKHRDLDRIFEFGLPSKGGGVRLEGWYKYRGSNRSGKLRSELGSIVERLRALGYRKVDLNGIDDGLKVWPRMGADAKLTQPVKSFLRRNHPDLREVDLVSQLLVQPGGLSAWDSWVNAATAGRSSAEISYPMWIDLAPNSYSMKVLGKTLPNFGS